MLLRYGCNPSPKVTTLYSWDYKEIAKYRCASDVADYIEADIRFPKKEALPDVGMTGDWKSICADHTDFEDF